MVGIVASAIGLRPRVDDLAVTLKQDPEFLKGVERGIQALRDGKMLSWSEVKKELDLE